jgi:hypothetical protein
MGFDEVGVMRFWPIEGTISLRVLTVPLVMIAAVIAGCSSDALKNASATSPVDPKAAGVGGAPNTDVECPSIQVRNGASTWQTPTGGSTTDLRYQASLGQMARECALLGDTMTVKVGVEGRLLVGPKGAPGNVEVPLRLALVQEGPHPKSIWTRFYPVQVNLQPGQSGTAFTHVEDDLTFAMPASKDITAYVIYVGFDPQGLNARKKKAPPHKAAPKPQAKKKSAPPRVASPGGFAPPAQGGFAPPANGGFAPPGNSAPPAGRGFAPPPGQFTPPPASQ